jgi:hypothetical protein
MVYHATYGALVTNTGMLSLDRCSFSVRDSGGLTCQCRDGPESPFARSTDERIAAERRAPAEGESRAAPALAKPTNRTFETEWVMVFTLRAGQVVRLRAYYDTTAMVIAFRSLSTYQV